MISQNEIRRRARIFAKEWEKESSEDAEAKSFWDGFFDVFGMSRRRVASFEYNVKKQNNSQGFIDVFWKGVMLAEHKSRGKDLDKAFTQAKDYFPGLKDEELPRYVIVSDFEKFHLYDLETNKDYLFTLNTLTDNIHLFDFISGHNSNRNFEAEEEVSITAAKLMAEFHNEIAKTGYTGHELEVFMIRVLFCLFADDTGIFEQKALFRAYIEDRTNVDGSDLGMHLNSIFNTLNKSKNQRQTTTDEQLNQFPYINGGIFAESISPVALDTTARLKLIKCCSFDWSNISASIFGSLFQGVMEKEERRKLGAHYTSEINILKVIRSLFLDELYIEFDSVKYDKKKLDIFHNKLSTLTFLDPACGCGNFLVVAYRELRLLELEILKRKKKNNQMVLLGGEELSKINVNQFYGIEIEEFPSLVARVAMYLADHQMNLELEKEFGMSQPRIPLREPATIVNVDALAINWEDVISKDKLSYILGNPPFVGSKLMNKEQRNAVIESFDNDKGVGVLDFVTAWYAKAVKYMHGTQIKTAFVSTNSICQGEQSGLLWNFLYKNNAVIHFAHQTFKWSNDAPGVAAVYCVIVGFATFNTPKKYLFEYETIKSEPKEKEVLNINGYLVSGDNLVVLKRSKPLCNVPKMSFGNMPLDGGNLLLSDEEKEEFVKKEPLAEKYIQPLISAKEFLNNEKRWCLWLVGAEPSDLKQMPLVLGRIKKVKEFRESSIAPSTQKFASTPSLFRDKQTPKTYILIPSTSSENRKYIPLGFFTERDIANNSCHIVPNGKLYHFGVLHSFMHMTWVSYTCGRLKSDYRYSKDIVYNNFPWPEHTSDEQKKKVEDGAQKVLNARLQFPNSSLADLYDLNTMPPELVKAHDELDRAVDACYGRKFTSKEDRIEFLFELCKKYTNK